MSKTLLRALGASVRIASLAALAMLGTALLMRYAPGYFADAGELDGQHSATTRGILEQERQQQGSVLALTSGLLRKWARGDAGESRQYGVPVAGLVWPRARVTAALVARAVVSGWLVALALALPLSAWRSTSHETWVALPSVMILAAPVGALAMASMISGVGGPVLLLSLVVAARDFKFLYRLLQRAWRSPHVLYAGARGLSWWKVASRHVLLPLRSEMFGLAMMSLVLALSAMVPVEVVYDVPGLGQLAWGAAMNRDLPVLLSATLLVALCVGVASEFVRSSQRMEEVPCA